MNIHSSPDTLRLLDQVRGNNFSLSQQIVLRIEELLLGVRSDYEIRLRQVLDLIAQASRWAILHQIPDIHFCVFI